MLFSLAAGIAALIIQRHTLCGRQDQLCIRHHNGSDLHVGVRNRRIPRRGHGRDRDPPPQHMRS